MPTALEMYRQAVASQPICVDPWFAECLSRFRAGDESAGREISGSCLRLALGLAEEHPTTSMTEEELLVTVEEANIALMEGIQSFRGERADEFLTHAEQSIRERLQHDTGHPAG